MAVKRGLGRGLNSLIPVEDAGAAKDRSGVTLVDVNLIDTNLEQPRKAFDEEKLKELSQSIARHGMVQPIVVNRNGERYSIIAGERRYRAARMAGLNEVPVVVREAQPGEVMELALIENIQREDLNPIEEANAIRCLMQQHGLTQEEVAQRLSKSRPAIANSLRLLNLPAAVQEMLIAGTLQAGHARALAGLKDETGITALAARIASEGLSVREAENCVRALNEAPGQQKAAKPKAERPHDVDMQDAEEQMRNALGTRVSIQGTAERGKVVIEYFSKDDLQAIFDAIVRE